MTVLSGVRPGDAVLLLWSDLGPVPEQLQTSVESIKTSAGAGGRVGVENVERLSMGNYPSSCFDKIFSGCVGLATVTHDLDSLSLVTKLLRPGGTLTMVQLLPADTAPDTLASSLILSGLSVSSPPTVLESYPQLSDSLNKMSMSQGQAYVVSATKPNHEVGASRLLSFAKPAAPVAPAVTAPAASVWTLEDIDDDTVELMDDSTLLTEEDMVKPDPASLRVCGTTGKRKACKDCSCGLREELDSGKEIKKKDFTSSCGSCYLGDAFRCASCPYLGMPAFNPGDKIQLSDRQLNPDLREVK